MGKKYTAEATHNIENVSILWEYLTPKEREYLKQNYIVKCYKKNEMIYSEGDTPHNLLCLVNGKVKIFREGVGRRSQIVRIVKAEEYFGYRAMLAEEPYVTSAMAIEHSIIYIIPGQVFISLLKQNHELAFFFIKMLAKDLGISDSRSVNLTQKHIRGRLAESLTFLKDTYGYEADGATIGIYLSRYDLANFSNMTASNVTRTLAIFVNEKIITVDGRKIKVIDEDRLMRIAKFG